MSVNTSWGVSRRHRISKSLQGKIMDAISDAYTGILTRHAPHTLKEAPDMWQPEETAIFDMLTHMELEAKNRVRAVLTGTVTPRLKEPS